VTDNTDVVNRALQTIGTRTTVTSGELIANSKNEAIQANLILTKYRDQLLRMAPWNCGVKYANLVWLTSVPGTPENTSPATFSWSPGQPAVPWAYEYLYPDDCLRACWINPNQNTGFASGVPITTAVTGGAPGVWLGAPVKYRVALDDYLREPTSVTMVSGGTGYAANDLVILGTDTLGNNFNADAVPGGIVQIKVLTVDGSGTILTSQLQAFSGTQVQKTGMLFSVPTYTLVQVQTSGLGSGAQFTVNGIGSQAFSGRVILTNQEYANLAYVRQVTDPNVMDDMFIEAWANALGSALALALTGDKQLANSRIAVTNQRIMEARKADGNEGLTVNDTTPDFIRVRGIAYTEYYSSPWSCYDWGAMWPVY